MFDQGDLRLVLLRLIADEPSHGYELIKQIEELFSGAYSPSPGVIYPTLTYLEDLGWVRPLVADGAKKAFEITEEGKAALAANQAQVEEIFARIAAQAERAGRRSAPQIIRAMENLRLALRLRLERGGLSAEDAAAIAALLDEAALRVEALKA
jgi:DNA-binding PadR family transcriptional regulator